MTQKNLNPEAIVNELKGHSAFFPAPRKEESGKTPNLQRGKPLKRLGGKEVKRFGRKVAKREPSISEGWNENETWKGSHLYTDRERNLFDMIILKLREKYGLDARKKLLARAAIRLLADDLNRHGKASFIVSLLSGQIEKWVESLASKEGKRLGGKEARRPAS